MNEEEVLATASILNTVCVREIARQIAIFAISQEGDKQFHPQELLSTLRQRRRDQQCHVCIRVQERAGAAAQCYSTMQVWLLLMISR